MGEQGRLAGTKLVEPVPGTHLVASESLVLASSPPNQETIQCAQRAMQRGGKEAPIVPNPAKQHWPRPLGYLLQAQIVAQMQLPATHTLPHRFGCFGADRRGETDE